MNLRITALDLTAKEEALRQYALAQEHHSTQEQILVQEGRVVEATGEHEAALWCLQGYRKELDNRIPASRPILDPCGTCLEEQCDGCRMCRTLGRPT